MKGRGVGCIWKSGDKGLGHALSSLNMQCAEDKGGVWYGRGLRAVWRLNHLPAQ